MKKILFRFIGLLVLPFLCSCNLFYEMPTRENIIDKATLEIGYSDLYFVSEGVAYNNYLLDGTNYNLNFYCKTFVTYGSLDSKDTLMIFGYDELGEYFSPFEVEWKIKSSYDDVLNTYEKYILDKDFEKKYNDGIDLVTSKDDIDLLFENRNDKPEEYFIFRYAGSHYVYEVDDELVYNYIS